MQANIIAIVCSKPNYNIIELTFAINLHIIFIAVKIAVNRFFPFSISMGNCVLLTNKLIKNFLATIEWIFAHGLQTIIWLLELTIYSCAWQPKNHEYNWWICAGFRTGFVCTCAQGHNLCWTRSYYATSGLIIFIEIWSKFEEIGSNVLPQVCVMKHWSTHSITKLIQLY